MLKRLIQNVVSIFAFMLAIWAARQPVLDLWHGHWHALGIVAYWAIVATLFLCRKPSQDESTQLGHWLVAITASVLPFLLKQSNTSWPTLFWAGSILQGLSTVFIIVVLTQLGRSFGVIAARREVKTHGLYQLVRHPLYATEMLALFAVCLQHPIPHNALIWLAVMALQIFRIHEEEHILRKDPTYEAYCQNTRFRLIPGIY